MLDQLKIMVGVAALTFALTASLTAAMPGGTTRNAGHRQPSPAAAAPATANSDSGNAGDRGDAGDTAGNVATPGQANSPDKANAPSQQDGQPGCVQALTDHAQSRQRLQSHVNDPNFPQGGKDGNENALDHQCGGAFASPTPGASSPTPAANQPGDNGKSSQAPGQNGTAGPSAVGNSHGKSPNR